MKRFDTINVVPLIDVMLVLLAIVLTSASFIAYDKLTLDLADTTSTSAYQPPKDRSPVHFSIDENNHYFLDKTRISFTALSNSLDDLPPKTPIVLKIDKKTAFEYFVKLVDVLKLKKLTDITILTKGNTP